MKSIEVYNLYKEKYPNDIVIVKEGIFYKTYLDDAKIIWNLFNYKYSNDSVSFGNSPYDKVINELKRLFLGYVVVDKNNELIYYNGDEDIYKSYLLISNKRLDKYIKKNILIERICNILDRDFNKYKVIDEFLNDL